MLTKLPLAAISLAFILAACGGSAHARPAKTLIASTSTVVRRPANATGIAEAMIASGVPARVAFTSQPANDPNLGRRGRHRSEASLDDQRFPVKMSDLPPRASWRNGGAAIECYPSGSGAQRRYRALVPTENFIGSREGNDDVAGRCVLRLSNYISEPSWVRQYRRAFEAATRAVTGRVAASAATTVIPKQLTGDWWQGREMFVGPRGKVAIYDMQAVHARFSRVTAHRLSISGGTLPGLPLPASCSGAGTYRWTVLNHGDVIGEPGHELKLKKIHDACKQRVGLAGIWFGA